MFTAGLLLALFIAALISLGWATQRLLRGQNPFVRYAAAGVIPVVTAALVGWTVLVSIGTSVAPIDPGAWVGRPSPPPTSPAPPAFLPPSANGHAFDPAEFIRAQVAQLMPGQIVFNPSTTMRAGEPERVTVRISRDVTEGAVKQGLQGRGVPQVEDIKVGTFMRVRLFGSGFNITSRSDESQAIPEHQFAEWLFDVLPTEAGNRTLDLLVAVRFKLPNSEETMDLPVLTREIAVEVNNWWSIKQFFTENWKWFLGGLGGVLVGVVGFFAKRWLGGYG